MSAFWWGAISAVSLPLGAILGLKLNPSKTWTSSLMSFGGGALLAALSIELVAPSLHRVGFAPVGLGCLGGALLFMFLNAALNGSGGFLRKVSTTVRYLTWKKKADYEELLEKCSRIALFRALPPDDIQALMPCLRAAKFKKDETIFKKGDEGDKMYLIEKGAVEILSGGSSGDKEIARLEDGAAFGEMALLSGEKRVASVRTLTRLSVWTIDKADFDDLMESSPDLKKAVTRLSHERARELEKMAAEEAAEASQTWAAEAKAHLHPSTLAVSHSEIEAEHARHGGGAAFAIWLGILLDGIPESLVIGASMLSTGSVSMSLIVGVFLANFPEALSSAVGMKRQGTSVRKILWMWTSLTIMTGAGAAIGFLTFGRFEETTRVFVEGLAAGAMLAMIAETMLPEAAEQGGPVNGLMTVLGFLAAIWVGVAGGPH